MWPTKGRRCPLRQLVRLLANAGCSQLNSIFVITVSQYFSGHVHISSLDNFLWHGNRVIGRGEAGGREDMPGCLLWDEAEAWQPCASLQEGLQEGQDLLKVGDKRVEENMELREGRTMACSPTFYSCWRCLLEKCSTKQIHLLEYQMVGAASTHYTASPMLLSHW